MSTSTSKTSGEQHELQRQHRELVEKYSKTRGAERAGVARAIHSTQVDLRLAGLSYEAWSKPQARRKFEMSESALRQQIQGLRSLLASDDVEAPTKDAAERRLERFISQAEKRGLELSS